MQPLGRRTWSLLIALGAVLLALAGYKLVKIGFSLRKPPIVASAPKHVEETFESLMAKGEQAPAKELYLKALALNPMSAQAHNNLGYLLLEEGQLPEAERHFKQAIDLDPSCSECFNNLGFLKTRIGQYTEAESDLKQAIVLSEKHPEPYYNLGVLYEKNGDIGNAIYFYESFLRHMPDKKSADYLQVENRVLTLKGK